MASSEHRHAEELSAQAAYAVHAHQVDRARRLYFEAGESERKALEKVRDRSSRTWGILATSAANLFYKSGRYKDVEEFVTPLLGYTEIRSHFRAELEDLLRVIRGHLSEGGMSATEKEPEAEAVRRHERRLERYEIREPIGEGGLGKVYRAVDTKFGRTVALKIASTHNVTVDRDAGNRFARYALAASMVQHSNVVKVLDSGFTHDGTAFIVTEYLDGEDLGARLRKSQIPLDVEFVADVMLGVCAALHACHTVGIIHRNLKPANIFLVRTETGYEAKLLDFDLSMGPDEDDVTEDGQIVGTPQYMSPEQVEGRAIRESDQYALGVVLYTCLTNHLPYEDQQDSLLSAIGRGNFPPPRGHRPDLPQALEAIVLRAMSVRPADRFRSVHALGQELRRFASPRARDQWDRFVRPRARPGQHTRDEWGPSPFSRTLLGLSDVEVQEWPSPPATSSPPQPPISFSSTGSDATADPSEVPRIRVSSASNGPSSTGTSLIRTRVVLAAVVVLTVGALSVGLAQWRKHGNGAVEGSLLGQNPHLFFIGSTDDGECIAEATTETIVRLSLKAQSSPFAGCCVSLQQPIRLAVGDRVHFTMQSDSALPDVEVKAEFDGLASPQTAWLYRGPLEGAASFDELLKEGPHSRVPIGKDFTASRLCFVVLGEGRVPTVVRLGNAKRVPAVKN